QVVEDMKRGFKCNNQAFSSVSSENFIDPLVRFLSTAYDKHDTKALRSGSQLLLEFTKYCRNCVTNLSEDTCSVLASLLESDVIGEALAILETLSNQWSNKANVAASSALTSISKILDSVLGSDTDEEKEPALAIVLSLCSQSLEYCELVMYEGIIPYLVNISNKGNDNTKVKAVELLRLLREVEPNLNNSRDSNEDHFEEKKPSKKSSTIFKKLFGKSSSDSSNNKR
ncbi:U-box domain-containing protein 5-like, partial [Trifolium medium]|nr:U-box domain-containing protein 5-like [Trifolium medium]